MLFRVPYIVHSTRAKTKAQVAYYLLPGCFDMVPLPGAEAVEFEAPTFKAAETIAQERILPGDNRQIQGRTNIRYFRLSE